MSQENFYRDLILAESFFRRRTLVTTAYDSVRPGMLTGQLPKTVLWLSPRTVRGYLAQDFQDQPESQELEDAVSSFRQLADQLDPDRAPTESQEIQGRAKFDLITSLVRGIVMREWREQVDSILTDAEGWCDKRSWSTRRYVAELEEPLLGKYELSQLLFRAAAMNTAGVNIELKPAARFAVGSLGMCELSVVPSYESVRLLRGLEDWWMRLEAGRTYDTVKVLPWNEDGFAEAVEWLRQSG